MNFKKKILIVSPSFYPQNSPRSFRATELVKEFSKQGHDVTVYIPKDNTIHAEFEKEFGVKIKYLGERKLKDIIVSKSKNKIAGLLKKLYRRLLVQLIDYPYIELMFKVKKVLSKEKEYDLLISIAVPFPIHWGVAWARTVKKPIAKIWVADCGDPFYFSSHDSFKKLFYFKYLEKWFSRKADYISIPYEGLKKYFFKEFESKYKIIPQGFNFDEVSISKEKFNNEVLTFGFSGTFMKNSRDPRKFLDYLVKLDTPFRFVLYNRQKEFTDPYKEILGEKLIIKDYIPRNDLLYELSKMDFLVNLEYDDTNQIPSKLIDYSLAKRPILLITNDQFDKKVIDEFLSRNYQNQFKLDNIERYNIKNVASQFLNL